VIVLWLLPAFALLFAGVWVGVCLLLANVGGWGRLAAAYRADAPQAEAAEASYRRQSGAIGWVNYNSVLRLDVCPSGLRMDVPFFFRIGHPTLFIPWSEFHDVAEQQVLFRKFIAASVGSPEVARVKLPLDVWRARGAAGG
jgi:hypothetical protein